MGFSSQENPSLYFFFFFLLCLSTVSAYTNKSSNNGEEGGRRELASWRCNWFRGSWVYDVTYPLYDPYKCPFIDPQFNCKKYGRPDNLYLKYRWQPSSCSLPRFNGLYFLRKMRGKKIMFVGDSLSTNMWQSLACLIHAWVPNARYTLLTQKGLASLTFEDYGVTLKLYRTQFLVDLDSENVGRVLKLDSIKQGKMWRGMDVLIFNSWHWWTHIDHIQPWDYMEDGNRLYKDMNRLVAYYKGMTTWARWVNAFVNPSKTKVFFKKRVCSLVSYTIFSNLNNMAMFIKNKNMAFSLILMCFIVVSPMANAQFGGLPGTNILNIQGLVTCSINGSVSTNGTVIPPFAGVPVVLQCAGQNVSTTTTGANGVFSFPSTTVFPISLLSTLLASGCRVIVTAPLSRCNASLPTNGLLTAPVNLVGSTVTGGISILQFVNGLFRLL